MSTSRYSQIHKFTLSNEITITRYVSALFIDITTLQRHYHEQRISRGARRRARGINPHNFYPQQCRPKCASILAYTRNKTQVFIDTTLQRHSRPVGEMWGGLNKCRSNSCYLTGDKSSQIHAFTLWADTEGVDGSAWL